MSLEEPRIAIAASPREWAQRLHRHVADHGGAVVRATVLHPNDALAEDVQVFVVDDTTSFLSPRLVDDLHRRECRVLGVFDPDDPRGKGDLVDCGVDDVIERAAPPEAFVAAVGRLAGGTSAEARQGSPEAAPHVGIGAPPLHAGVRAAPPTPVGASTRQPRGQLTVVAGASGGTGATEIAIGLARAAAQQRAATVLVDVDDVAPSLAQRLGVPLYPNVRAALDAMQHRTGTLDDHLSEVAPAGFALLPGITSGRSWGDVRPGEVIDLLRALTSVRDHVVANVGHRIEQLPAGAAGTPRYALARQVLAAADRVLVVAMAAPVGLARLLEWLADAQAMIQQSPTNLVVNFAPGDRFRRAEIVEELGRAVPRCPVWFVPHDPQVTAAAWEGGLPAPGPFTKAVRSLAGAALPAGARPRRRPWRR